MTARVILCDKRDDVVEAWRLQFDQAPDVEVRQGDVFDVDADALVLAGNSFGFLDRGLELEVCERLGFDLQDRLRERIRGEAFGELLVGEATSLDLGADSAVSFRELIYAPIYRTPRPLGGTLHAYLAARGAFRVLRDAGERIGSVALSGLGTGSAGLHPVISARQVRYAWEIHAGLRGFGDKNLTQLTRRERKLCSLPKSVLEGESAEAEDS